MLLKIVIGFLLYIATPFTCTLILVPISLLTGVECAWDEDCGIRRNGKYIGRDETKTELEHIISTQEDWSRYSVHQWPLTSFVFPHVYLYIIFSTFGAVLLVPFHLYKMKYHRDKYN